MANGVLLCFIYALRDTHFSEILCFLTYHITCCIFTVFLWYQIKVWLARDGIPSVRFAHAYFAVTILIRSFRSYLFIIYARKQRHLKYRKFWNAGNGRTFSWTSIYVVQQWSLIHYLFNQWNLQKLITKLSSTKFVTVHSSPCKWQQHCFFRLLNDLSWNDNVLWGLGNMVNGIPLV